jgi:hypothetical protein
MTCQTVDRRSVVNRDRATSSHLGGQAVALTPTADTNGVGCHDPLSDLYTLFPQLGEHIGQLCGIS